MISLDLRLRVKLNGKLIQEILLCQHELQPVVLVGVGSGSSDVREQAAPSPQAVVLNHSPELHQLVRLLRVRSQLVLVKLLQLAVDERDHVLARFYHRQILQDVLEEFDVLPRLLVNVPPENEVATEKVGRHGCLTTGALVDALSIVLQAGSGFTAPRATMD